MREGYSAGPVTYAPTPGGTHNIQVSKENVLDVARIVQDEADQLRREVDSCKSRMRTEPARDDPASKDFAEALNWKLVDAPDSYINCANNYVNNLKDLVVALKASAREYGYTEEDIRAALGGNNTGSPSA